MTEQESFSFRWGIDILDSGFVSIPNVFFDHYAQVCSYKEFCIILHLARYQFEKAGSECRPSLQTIAEQMGVQVLAIRKSIKDLERRKLLSIARVPGKPSVYSFAGFSKAILSHSWVQGGMLEDSTMLLDSTMQNDSTMPEDRGVVCKSIGQSYAKAYPKKKKNNNNLQSIFEMFLNFFEQQTSKATFNHLFGQSELLAIDNGIMTVLVKSEYVLDTLQNHAGTRKIVERTLEQIEEVESVEFVV